MGIGKFLLISGHASSKKEKNEKQIAQIKSDLELMARKLPNHHIVLGMDANNGDFEPPKGFRCFPEKSDVNTVYKMRTHMQVQTKKAGVLSNKRSDYIVTNLNFNEGKVVNIEGKPIQKDSYLPSIHHPFDHFLVTVVLPQDTVQ